MNDGTPTYTRSQAMEALGIISPSAFHHLRRRYPRFFVVVKAGMGRNNPTLYHRELIDRFVELRKEMQS
jgi:hypothetical protein